MKYGFILLAVIFVSGCTSRKSEQQVGAPPTEPALFRTVIVDETNPMVFISGEVNRPGSLLWHQGLALTNAIGSAGGFTGFADTTQLGIHRSQCNGTNMQPKDIYVIGPETNDILLEQGDIVQVNRRSF